ncbi:MAG: JDVT-CTERM domain-containing protein [Candidatus Thiodiazotropha sp. (ex Monitilora ramsayi)]|nr:JDVT-CTERM domain-containing protein [Candidatus Thiodiazotropha sp. (ex Monitilora ramsayi)]
MIRRSFLVFVGFLVLISGQSAYAEGSFQVGLNQPLLEESNGSGFPMYIDVLSVGEVINVSACGQGDDTHDIRIQIFDPDSLSVLDTTLTDGNVSCTDPFTAPLTNPVRYTTLKSGSYEIRLNNENGTELYRFDISVTPDAVTNPDPIASAGRLWAYQWGFYTHSFGEAASTDSDYYPLVPGGRTNTNYVWKLDLNKFSGNLYVLSANDLGVDAPYSGYSIPTATGSVTPKFPIYVNFPAVAQSRPDDPPVISGFRFIDNADVDFGITPTTSPGVQDSGNFEFTSDVEGTYSIIIDTDSNGVYGANDKLILGNAVVGPNQVSWSGDDADGNPLPVGTYNARLQLRLGEYHFIAEDAETSGGLGAPGGEEGLTVYIANSDGSVTDTYVYWDDETFLSGSGGTSNLPDGALSSTSAGKHTWGDFTGTSVGNQSYVDTYVYGLSSFATAQTAITADDTLLTGTNGAVTSTPASLTPGNTLTVEVNDADLNILPTITEIVVVEVTNGRTGEVEQITLSETAINTGIFSLGMPTLANSTAGTNNDGTLQVWDGDVVTTSYQDQLDTVGSSQTRTAVTNAVNDQDGEGLTDAVDIDDDNDGISDLDEGDGAVDTDGDGIPDSLDLDSDNDGLSDLVESGAVVTGLDTNNDGVIDAGNSFGTNGLADALETTADSDTINYTLIDTDTDGVYDFRDLDSDNDGIPDVTEAGGSDPDGDGVIGNGTPIVDGNGTPAGGGLTVVDTDGDGTGDQQELDADNDGIYDLVEAGGTDTNSDGLVDGFTDADGDGLDDTLAASPLTPTDSNGDGLPDFQDNTDSDADGLVDTVDLDDDNDSILDTAEGSEAVDTDGDAIPDSLDLDSDNDGLFDLIESGAVVAGLDINNDGRIDSGNTVGSNGLADVVETVADSGSANYTLRDTDSDTVHDFRDLDSDNDGIPDVTEAGGSDPDGDGLIGTGVPVVNGDGVPAGGGLTPPNTDNDGVPDQIDTDADGDGLFDLVEGGGTDGDNNGLVDGLTDADGDGLDDNLAASPLPLPDSNSDGIPDFLDPTDSDGDGLVDTVDIDDDNDGILDTAEGSEAVDTDGDTVPDSLDLDSDNDGLSDLVESGAVVTGLDGDGDGRIDSGNTVGGNGLADVVETIADSGSVNYTLRDTDTDTVHDFRDLDSDGDGINDLVEAGGTDANDDGLVDAPTDSDGDGLDDSLSGNPLTPPDYNNDGTPDYRDGNDSDSDGVVDSLDLDLDNDGIPNTSEGNGLVNTDGDGLPDTLDLDADGDGLYDIVEAGGTDTNSDGLVDTPTDANGDGLDDTLAASPLPLTDSNSDGTPDFQDGTDSDGDGLVDSLDVDDDNDGILDTAEGSEAVDTDSDGVPDSLDLDSDNDGLFDLNESGAVVTGLDADDDGRIDSGNAVGSNGMADVLETTADSGSANYTLRDTDADTVHDFRDIDSDGDGLYDLVEAGGADTDDNGRVDGLSDLDGDGLHDGLSGSPLPTPDTDGDTVVDYLDLDSDNDGIYDVMEAGGSDPDGDGLLGNSPQTVDTNGAAPGSGLNQVDTDSDGIVDRLDLDSDNDGIPDVTEAGGSDPDGDGVVGSGTPTVDGNGVTSSPIQPGDADSDSTPNHLDSDADGDGLLDIVEAGGVDSNSDGLVDGFTDGNGDGLDDPITSTPLPLPDSDGDTIPDYLDNDDQDNDGVPDTTDLDLDNDGIPNNLEGNGTVDTDGDGVPDSIDLDSDNDGLYDLDESGADATALDGDANGRIDGTQSVGSNGLADVVESSADSGTIGYNGGVLRDSDTDGVPDFRDLDSDNDGLYDVTESGGNDPDGDGVVGTGTPTVNGDGEAPGTGQPAPDTDGDGVADPADLDSDNDGVPDTVEAGGTDPDGDGQTGSGSPSVDPNTGVPLVGGGLTKTDTDGDGTPDSQDTDSDGDGVSDLVESGIGATDTSPQDGMVDGMTDTNGNGLDDALEGTPVSLPDSDGDGIPDLKDDTVTNNETPLQTGLNGVGGCALGRANGFDPLLPLLAILSLTYLGWRRRQSIAIRVKSYVEK